MAKSKAIRLVTPKGVASFPWLNRPDTKFNKAGEYKVELVLTEEQLDEPLKQQNPEYDGKSIREILTEALDKHYDSTHEDATAAERKVMEKMDVIEEVLDEDDNPTGEYKIKFKLRARVTPREGKPFTQKPALYDARRNQTNVSVFGGSILKVIFEIHPYVMKDKKNNKLRGVDVGLSLRLKAAQILELAESGAGLGNMFDEEEDGFEDDGSYEAAEDTTAEGQTDGSDDDDDEEDDEF